MDNPTTQSDQPAHSPQPSQPPRSGPPIGLIIGIAVGCGVLVLILGIIVAVGFGQYRKKAQQLQAEQTLTPIETPEVAPGGTAPEIAVPSEELAQPGEAAALAFALSRKTEWTAAEVTTHAEDWRTAEVVIGPSPGEYGIWLILTWNDELSTYELVDEGPIAQVEPQDEYGEEVPDIYQPGEQTALEAALMDVPDWVGKVAEHSADWKSVTVWIGEPASEWSFAYELEWNDEGNYYDIVSSGEIPYP